MSWTHRDTFTAIRAQVPVDTDLTISFDNIDRNLRALFETQPAFLLADALLKVKSKLRFGMDTFRVTAPLAAQRAALEKHIRTYPRSIMGAEMLYVEYPACQFGCAVGS